MSTDFMKVIRFGTRAGESKTRFIVVQHVVISREAVTLYKVEHLAGLDMHRGIMERCVLTVEYLHRRALQHEILAGFGTNDFGVCPVDANHERFYALRVADIRAFECSSCHIL